MTSTLPIIGKTCLVSLIGHVDDVSAKVDTGADSSSIWASNITIDKNGVLHFTLFDENSPFYTGEVISRKDFTVAQVRSSNGQVQIRYRTVLPVRIEGRRIRALFNLSDRSRNKYPVLIGRRTIAGKFFVDVTRGLSNSETNKVSRSLTDELKKNPHAFFKKYHQK